MRSPVVERDHTLAVTFGWQWGGFYVVGTSWCWRVCLGFVAVTYLHAEFTHVLAAWLDREEADSTTTTAPPSSPESSPPDGVRSGGGRA